MTIGQTRFWMDNERGHLCIRSANRETGTQPFEIYLNRRPDLVDLKFYETTDEGGLELRLSFKLLWLSINMLICMLTPREDGHRFDERDREWGWHFMHRCLVIQWGLHRLSWDLPFFTTSHVRTEVLSLSRNRVVYTRPEKGGFDTPEWHKGEAAKAENSAVFDYEYELNNGTKQQVKATVHVERQHRIRKWTPFRSATDSICVSFSAEVGSERGSYKGGVTGCGYTIKGKETARECLRRMERERRFERH